MAHSADTVFSTPTTILGILFVGCLWVLFRGIRKEMIPYFLIALSVPWIFFVGGILSETFVNTRYAIFIQPLWALLASFFVLEILHCLKKETWRKYMQYAVLVGTTVGMAGSLWSIFPYYINYHNVFLPKKYVIADSWSYGIYEGAQYLNQKPFAEYLEVWSDRSAFCEHFIGKCLKSATANSTYVKPDYIVTTRRNVVKNHRFSWEYPQEKKYRSAYYYETMFDSPEWELTIGGRKENYVKIFPIQKEKMSTKEREEWIVWK